MNRFRMSPRIIFVGGVLVCLLQISCAGPNAMAKRAARLEFAELEGEGREEAARKLVQPPVVLHFRAGDRVPVNLELDSSLARLETQSVELVAKRDFYVLFRPDKKPLLSEDGVDFKRRRRGNYFSLGLGVTKDEGPRVGARIGFRPEQGSPQNR